MPLPIGLASLFEHSLDGLLLTRPTGEILRANPAACRLLGRTEEELRHVGRAGVIDPADERLGPVLEERARTGRVTAELTVLRADGGRIPAEVSSATFDDGGERFAWIVMRDLGAAKRAEAALRAATDNLRAVVQAAPLAIHVISPEGVVLLWNPAAERLFGWAAEEVIGGPSPTVPVGAEAGHRALRERVLAGESLTGIELTRRRRDGGEIEVALSTAPLRDRDGRITGILGLYEDITRRKAAERLRIRAEQVDALRQLAVGLRHEMNNCLAGLMGELQLLELSSALTADDRESLRGASEGVRRLAATLRRLDHVEDLHSVPYMGDVRMLDVSATEAPLDE